MGTGPITIFDKSALQSLSMDESVCLDAFFLVNVVPLFYAETLADLEKEVAEGRSPEDLVGMLAVKTPPNAVPNVHHRSLISAPQRRHAPHRLGAAPTVFPVHAAICSWSGEQTLIYRPVHGPPRVGLPLIVRQVAR